MKTFSTSAALAAAVLQAGQEVRVDNELFDVVETSTDPLAITLANGNKAAPKAYTSLAKLKTAKPSYTGQVFNLVAGGRSGPFETLPPGDYSAEIAADPLEGIYVLLDDGQTLKRHLNGYVEAEWFGWPESEAGVTASAAISVASLIGISTVSASSDCLNQTTPIIGQTGVTFRGITVGRLQIKTADGTAIESQYLTPNFNSVYAAKNGTTLNGVVADLGLENIWLNGNRGNCPVPTDWKNGLGIKAYWLRPTLKNVLVTRSPGIGVVSAYYDDTKPGGYNFWSSDNMESNIRDKGIDELYVYDTGFESMVWEGPADARVGKIFTGWSSSSSDAYRAGGTPAYDSLVQSLKFATGGVRAVKLLTGGSGYTTATVSVTGGSGSGALVEAVIDGGAIVDLVIVEEGFNYDRASMSISISGDGTGATASALVDDGVDGFVVYNNGAEFDFVHTFQNPNGWGINVRGESGEQTRIRADYLVTETSLGGTKFGADTKFMCGKIEDRNNQLLGGDNIFPSLATRSLQGGTITAYECLRGTAISAVSPCVEISGDDVSLLGGRVTAQGKNVSAVKVIGPNKTVRMHVTGTTGSALVTSSGFAASDIDITTDKCITAWKNQAGNNLSSSISITAGAFSSDFSTQFIGVDSINTDEWVNSINVILSDVNNRGVKKYGKGIFSDSADCTITTAQTITIAHDLMRTPDISECTLTVRHNASSVATAQPVSVARISATSATTITAQVKFSAVGSGTANVQVRVG